MRPPTEARKENGFTLSEVMITVVIVGILSAIALPNYFNQVQRTKQNEAVATLSQILQGKRAKSRILGRSFLPKVVQTINEKRNKQNEEIY